MKRISILYIFLLCSYVLVAQRGADDDKIPAYRNLFTGGSLNLAFFGNTFMVGGSPVIGYSLTNFLDAGVVVNYNYTRYRDYNGVVNDRLQQYIYGGGGFVRLYPLRFIFLQAQVERNSIQQRYEPANGLAQRITVSAPSTLIGGGYCTGRQGRRGGPFYYLSVMFDVAEDLDSPYTDAYGRSIPIVRGGIQIPLFQGAASR
jgi:hypothetical protein